MFKLMVCSILTAFVFHLSAAEQVSLTIKGSDRPRVGIALVATIDIDDCAFRWVRGNTKGIFESVAISETPEYIPQESDYEHWIKVSVYRDEVEIASNQIWFSKLPVVYINTDDGAAITSKDVYKTGFLRIQGNDAFPEQYGGAMEIKGRGNTSWSSYKQKPYKLKLDSKTNLFGFGKNKHWVMISNYGDNAMMRNKFASDLAKELGIVGMDMTWTPCIFNGKYNGVYMFAEQIRVDKNRVDVYDWEGYAEDKAAELFARVAELDGLGESDLDSIEDIMSEDLGWITSGKVAYKDKIYDLKELELFDANLDFSGGYLFQLDGRYDEISKFKTSTGLMVSLDKPEYAATDASLLNSAKDVWANFESAYKSADGYANGKHFTELCDLDSMVAFWLVNEFMSNMDAPVFSRYAFKGRGEKLKFGPVWDFDYGANSIQVQASNYEGRREATSWACAKFHHSNATYNKQSFFADWLDDPIVCLRACQIYKEKVRPWAESLLTDGGVLDVTREYLSFAGDAHDTLYKRWGFNGSDGDVAKLKTFLRERVEWLDKQFVDTDTLMASVSTPYSCNQYVKSSDILQLVFNEDNTISVSINDADITSVRLYVNGLLEVGGQVDLSSIETNIGEEIIIACDGYDQSGKILARNYIVVKALINPPVFEGVNTFIPAGNGVALDDDANWTHGYYPKSAGAHAAIGAPTEVKKNKGWRNLHVNQNDIVVGRLEITNGGWTNRIDTGTRGNIVFDGGDAAESSLVIADESNSGLAIIDLDSPNMIKLETDMTIAVSNVVGDTNYGGLYIKGLIAGQSHNLKKTGPGRLTLALQNAEGLPTIDKLQCEEGVLAIEKPLTVKSITKSGPLWVLAEANSLEQVKMKATCCLDKLSAKKVCLFVPTTTGNCMVFGGVVAKSGITAAANCEIYTKDVGGAISFAGSTWSKCSLAEVEIVEVPDGGYTYLVSVAPQPPKSEDGSVIVDAETYGKYFTKRVSSDEGSLYILDNDIVDIDTSLAEFASALTDLSSEYITIPAKSGLYYSVSAAESLLSDFVEGQKVLAIENWVTLFVPKFPFSGFYRINVSATRGE